MLIVYVLGCGGGAETVLETTTDGGTWQVSLDAPPTASGEQVLDLSVDPTDGALVAASTLMPSMGHGSDGQIAAVEPGRFEVTVDLSMAGWWVLDGEVASSEQGDGAEAFRLEFEVP